MYGVLAPSLLGKLTASAPRLPVTEARWVPVICDPGVPLYGDDQKRLWQDLQAARGGERFEVLERAIRWAPPGRYQKHLVSGHAGAGKSTELLRLAAELGKEKEGRSFHVVYMDAFQYLDIADVELPEFLAAFLPALLDDELLEVPATSSAKVLWGRLRERARSLGPEVAQDLVEGIKGLRVLFRKSPGFQRRFREVARAEVTALLADLGNLFQEVRNRLVRQGVDDLVVIVDNLEKIPLRPLDHDKRRSNHDLFFIEELPAIQDLPVHLILSFPLSLAYSQARLRLAFPSATSVVTPMVRVRRREDKKEDAEGVAALRELLGRRLDLGAVFAGEDVIRSVIQASGGCLRDLLRTISQATLLRGALPLGQEDIDFAVREQVSGFERVLQGRGFLAQLHELERSGAFPVGFDDEDKQWLLHELIVVEYNGDTWYDVHPFTRRTRAYQQAAPPRETPSP